MFFFKSMCMFYQDNMLKISKSKLYPYGEWPLFVKCIADKGSVHILYWWGEAYIELYSEGQLSETISDYLVIIGLHCSASNSELMRNDT